MLSVEHVLYINHHAQCLQKTVNACCCRAGESSPPEEDSIIKDLLPEDAGIDHQTVHQLIMVLMKFMAKDKSSAEADIGSAKAFNTVKRHLYVLLGYDQQMGCFMITPQKMRSSTCFNAFIAGIAQVSSAVCLTLSAERDGVSECLCLVSSGYGLQYWSGEAAAAAGGAGAEVLHVSAAEAELPGAAALFAVGPQTTHTTDVAQSPACHPLQGIQPNYSR